MRSEKDITCFASDERRLRILRFIPSTPRTIAAVRSVNSQWRNTTELSRSSDCFAGTLPSDVLASRDGKRVIVVFRGDSAGDAAANYGRVGRPLRRDVLVRPRDCIAHRISAAGQKFGAAMTERQLYKVFHVIDTVMRARPSLDLHLAVDYCDWFPRAIDGGSVKGFTDPETVASITPPLLRSLAFGPSAPLPTTALQSMLTGCFQLRRFEIESWCDDDVLATVARCAPTITTLTIRQAPKVTDESLRFVGQFMRGLISVTFSECPRVTDVGLACVIRGAAGALEHVAFPFCERLTDLTLTQLAASCGLRLQSLDLSGTKLITPQGLLFLFTQESRLQSLSANFCQPCPVDRSVLQAIVDHGWTVTKVSCAFTDILGSALPEDERSAVLLFIEKLRRRGVDFMF